MADYTTRLRDLIYTCSQDLNPYEIAQSAVEGTTRYPFIWPFQDISVYDRIDLARDIILEPDIEFYSDGMKTEFWKQFCVRNLMREIEYEEPAMWILQFNSNVRGCINRYNRIYATLDIEIDMTNSHYLERYRKTEGDEKRNSTDDGNSSTTTTNTNTQRTVFEDTPESSLGNSDYATNITDQTGNDNGRAEGSTHAEGTEFSDYRDHEGLTERGWDGPQAEIIQRNLLALTDVITDMVEECSKRIFLKIYSYT